MVALMSNQAAIRSSSMSDEGFKRLMEIETKYRTHRSADQLHAIALFPKLFDDFPVAVIINAAILKLADYYRNRLAKDSQAEFSVKKKVCINVLLSVIHFGLVIQQQHSEACHSASGQKERTAFKETPKRGRDH